MTSVLVAVVGIVALVAAPLGVRWLVHWRHYRRVHGRHAATPGEIAAAGEAFSRSFYGSMTLAGEREIQAAQDQHFGTHFMLHGPAHRDPVCFWCGTEELEQAAADWPADPVPWEDLQPGARIEDDRDGDQTAAWFHGLGEDPGPGVDRPPPPGPVPPLHAQLLADAEAFLASPTEPSRLAPAAEVDAARPWLDVQLEDLYVWVRGVLAA